MFGLWTNIQLLLDYGPHFIWFLVQLANNGWQSSYGWSNDLKPAVSGKLSTLLLMVLHTMYCVTFEEIKMFYLKLYFGPRYFA